MQLLRTTHIPKLVPETRPAHCVTEKVFLDMFTAQVHSALVRRCAPKMALLLMTSFLTNFASIDQHAALHSWLLDAGAMIGSVRLEEQSGVRGLYITKAVQAGEPLIAVPPQCTLVAHAEAGLKAHEALALKLLKVASAKEFPQYLETLPTEVPLLRDWTDAELAQLEAPSLASAAIAQRKYAEDMVRRLIPRAIDLYDGDEAKAAAALRWAERIIRSRTHGWTAKSGPAQANLQLVPLIDMCNHCSDGSGEEEAEASRADPLSIMACGTVLLCAGTDLAPGDEVTFSYRPAAEGNGALLLDYGFAILPSGAGISCDALRLDPRLCREVGRAIEKNSPGSAEAT